LLLVTAAHLKKKVPFQVYATGSANIGPDFLESHIGWSVTVPEFQAHSGNNALKTAFSFSETTINHKWAN
jgi:hypothetical protein